MRPSPRFLALPFLLLACTAGAAPDLTVTPPTGARFLPGQRFDLRVEGKGTGPFSATLAVNGEPVEFSSGGQGTVETDGITAHGYGGFDLRGFSLRRPGVYTLRATFTDATGTSTADSRIEVVDLSRHGGGRVRNVILLLGDGMGVAHRTAARIVSRGVQAGDPKGWLAMDLMPGTGLVTTHSLDGVVTDSAAGMSSYTSGNHAADGQLGVFPAHVTSSFFAPRVEYLGAYLHRMRGLSTGIVTTADLADATPAATASHTGNRGAATGIADQLLDESGTGGAGRDGSGLRVLLGGGRRWLVPASEAGSSRSAATDYPALPADLAAAWDARGTGALDPDRDLLGDFRRRGFAVVSTAAELARAASNPPEKLLGAFAPGDLSSALDKLAARRSEHAAGREAVVADQPMLDEMTRAALAVLSDDQHGFFLMVEGALIDKQSHARDGRRMVAEVLELDGAVEAALEFARKDGRTLVIVVADHETSAPSVPGAPVGGAGSGEHTAADVPISAYAGDELAWRRFVGVQRNVDVFFGMAAALGIQ